MSASFDPMVAILDRIKEKALANARRPENVKAPRKAVHTPKTVGNGRRRRVRRDREH